VGGPVGGLVLCAAVERGDVRQLLQAQGALRGALGPAHAACAVTTVILFIAWLARSPAWVRHREHQHRTVVRECHIGWARRRRVRRALVHHVQLDACRLRTRA
jgi:hypothetical protein